MRMIAVKSPMATIEQQNFGRHVREELTVAMLRKRVWFLLKCWRCHWRVWFHLDPRNLFRWLIGVQNSFGLIHCVENSPQDCCSWYGSRVCFHLMYLLCPNYRLLRRQKNNLPIQWLLRRQKSNLPNQWIRLLQRLKSNSSDLLWNRDLSNFD